MKKTWKILGGITLGVLAVAAAPITGGGSLFAGAAALGLGSAAAIGSAAAVGAAGGFLANYLSKDKMFVKKGLVILGMQDAGKTTIYDFLQGKKRAGVSSNVDDYDEFTYSFDKENAIVIREGKDIGGGEEFIKKHYNKMINDTNIDFCFFVFNSFKYLNDKTYERNVNARFHIIYEKKILNKKTAIIGSFMDQFTKQEKSNVYNRISERITHKSYAELLSKEYFHLIDLTKEIELKKFINKTLIK